MSADTFIQVSKGKNANEAFTNAVEQAAYDHGHAGYTGTMAEKDSFVMIPLPKRGKKDLVKRAVDYATKLIDKEDDRIEDKWGPAGCIRAGRGKYVFFGWASS